jgi:Reverse transcriptase-like
MQGLTFWYPEHCTGFYAPVPQQTARDIIFYFEVLAMVSACTDLSRTMVHCSKIIIYTDSMNMVDILNSLWCQPEFNPLLRHWVDIMINKNFQVQVLHVPAEQNTVADAISCREFDKACKLVPSLQISTFQPPQLYVDTSAWHPERRTPLL